MTQRETSIIKTYYKEENGVFLNYRLIRTTDGIFGEDVFSVFLTSGSKENEEEDFVYDIARVELDAMRIFDLLCHGTVTVCTLRDVIYDLLAER